ncbi:MAG: FAD-dependent oxidoreductase, partial [Planctomycetota bacterium]
MIRTQNAFIVWIACAALGILVPMTGWAQSSYLLEAEQFTDLGGWDVDQQSLDQLGSCYVLAHGLGVPVKDAKTTLKIDKPGQYKVWVRTRNWVAPWKVGGAPGKFRLSVNGAELETTFGTVGEEWHWHAGGDVELLNKNVICLKDLTGFNGRCDAIVFSSEPNFVPPNELESLKEFRRQKLGLDGPPRDGGDFDLVVVGGGLAGCCTALSAARNGLSVALIQDRPVLGGNGSSEVRVWPEGHTRQQPYVHIGDIVEELMVPRGYIGKTANARRAEDYGDSRKMNLVRSEPRIQLFTEQRVFAAKTSNNRITSVVAQHIRTAVHTEYRGKLFADCTGDGAVGFSAGADYEMTRTKHQGMSNLWNLMDASDPKQVLKCECKDKTALGVATKAGKTEMEFPRCPWAIDLTDKPFPGRGNYKAQWGSKNPLENLGGWFWESGFDRDPINDVERIRDLNLRAMFGAWDALKNVDDMYPNHRIAWAAFIAGKRESRRLMGDVVLSADDFRDDKKYEDGCFPCSWHIDVHSPHKDFAAGHEGDEFISYATTGKGYKYKGPYWGPYRSLYSRNISNLFMAGRDISVTHEGLGPVRVMRTCGMMGEVVGKAAWLCVHHSVTPREVYQKHLDELKGLMKNPGSMRRGTIDGPLKLPEGYDFSLLMQPVPESAKFIDEEYEIWGGAPVKGDDGLYHMYYSRWPRELTHQAWVTHSEIAHAVSESPTGPWEHKDVALPARGGDYWDGNCTHNPTVLKRGRKYFLYYMGNRGNGKVEQPLN